MAAVERTVSSSFEEFSSKSSGVGEDNLEDEEHNPQSPKAELENLQHLIELIKDNLEALNAEFGKTKEPPSIYLKEYDLLTNKIHNLQERELQLQEQLSFDFSEQCRTYDQPDTIKSTISSSFTSTDNLSYPSKKSFYNLPPPLHINDNNFYPNNGENFPRDRKMADSGSFRLGFIKAYLPHGQITTLKVKAGAPLKDLLEKGLNRRGIKYSECRVTNKTNSCQIDWFEDSSLYSGKEIMVEYYLCTSTNSNHNFVRKTLLSLSCHGCHKLIFQGLKCLICQKRFHVKCNPDNKYPAQDLEPSWYLSSLRPVSHLRSKSFPNVNQLPYQMRSADFGDYDNLKAHAKLASNSDTTPPPSTTSTTSPPFPTNSSTLPKYHSVHTSPINNAKKSRRDSNKDWEIPESDIIIGSKIGSGSYGIVFKGKWHGTVAIKKLNVQEPTPAQLQAFKNEVTVLRKMRHLNILYFMGCISSPQLAIVTQWCEGSSLFKHLHVYDERFDMPTLMVIVKQTAQGMDYLHARNIIHRDLKSNNIFLTDDFCVKIGDFGLATVKVKWNGEHQTKKLSGSVMWMSPEIIRMKLKDPYTFKSDVYAFGIVLFELLTNQMPYQIDSKDQIMYLVATRKLRPDMTRVRKDSPRGLVALINHCIEFDPDLRPLLPDILSKVEGFIARLPKITCSISMPALVQTSSLSDYELNPYDCTSPRTPINPKNAYTFPSNNNWRKI